MTARAIYVPLTIEAALANQIVAVAHAQFTAGRPHLRDNLCELHAVRRALSLWISGSPGEVGGWSHRLG